MKVAHHLKHTVCVLLSLCLLLAAVCIPASAAADACGCGEVLQVYVDGFGSPLYYNEGTPAQEEAGMARTDTLPFALGRLFRSVGLSALQRDWIPLAKGMSTMTFSLMGHLQMDPRGNSIAPITSRWHIDPAQDHRTEPEYLFSYDFRIDPYKAASQLHAFIEALCNTAGHRKIALTGCSEGAIVALTYLKEYGTARLETLILLNGAYQGLTLVGELLTKQFALSGPAITNYITNFDGGSGNLTLAMAIVRELGLLNFTAALGDGIMANMGDYLYDEVLIPLFGQMPVLWAFVPQAFYSEARQLISDPKYADLLAVSDKYHKEVQAQAGPLLRGAQAKGVKVAVIASHGRYPIPVTVNSTYQCDSLIDTANEAGGAAAAPIGQTLPENTATKYRSPDGVFDASTCFLPDQTWFVGNNGHDAEASAALRQWIIHAKGTPSITSNKAFPQYLTWQGNALVPA